MIHQTKCDESFFSTLNSGHIFYSSIIMSDSGAKASTIREKKKEYKRSCLLLLAILSYIMLGSLVTYIICHQRARNVLIIIIVNLLTISNCFLLASHNQQKNWAQLINENGPFLRGRCICPIISLDIIVLPLYMSGKSNCYWFLYDNSSEMHITGSVQFKSSYKLVYYWKTLSTNLIYIIHSSIPAYFPIV